MTSDIVKELRQLAAEARCGGSFAEVTLNEAATLIESQASEIANLKTNLTNCLEELGELSGPPLSRRVKLILEAKALLAEIKL